MKTKIVNNIRCKVSSLLLLALCMTVSLQAQNPFLPLWEFIPDGEPYVFEDPDKPGEYRVYVYGSHDLLLNKYCGLDQVVWSASVNDLTHWRYDGVIFTNTKNRDGSYLRGNKEGDLLYAPDIAVRTEVDGTKTYYLYPNIQANGRECLVAKSKRPDGPFEVCNWSKTDAQKTDGILGFDPAVFVDDDGRVYGYWGFNKSHCAELDPTTMATLKPGTKILENMVSSHLQEGVFRFFEASSIRKIQDKYVFIYSRYTADGEKGLPSSNYTLAYAYSDNPMGPFTYGGTIIDGRGVVKGGDGKYHITAYPEGNTHGSIFEVDGQWWVVYHRHTGLSVYSRQAMVAPIDIKVEKGKGGKVTISEGEFTSEGFAIEGLNPLHRTSAGLACYFTSPVLAHWEYPKYIFNGSYIMASRVNDARLRQYNLKEPTCRVVNNLAGCVVGYKYFNMKKLDKKHAYKLALNIKPQGVDGTITVLLGAPSENEGAKVIGQLRLSAFMPQENTVFDIPLDHWQSFKGKQPLFFRFESATTDRSLCDMNDFIFM
ncbi:MAG: family 43 glycosylhydrolase [Bacteroidales bacterium]|nr:family 43 glycosylhydrolase [Bacteroidales bacterium]